jgi:hypothetical protein
MAKFGRMGSGRRLKNFNNREITMKGGEMVLEIKRILKHNDVRTGLIFLIFGAVLLQQTLLIDIPQSRLFSYCVIGMILISGISLVVSGLIKKNSGSAGGLRWTIKELVIMVMLPVTYFTINILGFYSAIYLFLIVSYLYIEGTWSKSAVMTAFIFNTLLIGILYLSFTVFLGMMTPTGWFL